MAASDTPIKKLKFLSPSSNEICIICYEDLQIKYKGNAANHSHKILLSRAGKKTETCVAVEQFLKCSLEEVPSMFKQNEKGSSL